MPHAECAPGVGCCGGWQRPARWSRKAHFECDQQPGAGCWLAPTLPRRQQRPAVGNMTSTPRRCHSLRRTKDLLNRCQRCGLLVSHCVNHPRIDRVEASPRRCEAVGKGQKEQTRQVPCENSMYEGLSTGRIAMRCALSGLENRYRFAKRPPPEARNGERNYMSMVLRIKPTARPSISNGSPG
jgi:hypothetical protein